MLPGFRFLFAATLLTISLVVFGLGAAALLRASHDRFVSLPIRPVTGPALATVADAKMPTLSMLRVEAPEPAESRAVPESVPPIAPADTLVPNDRVATFITAPRVDDVMPAPPVTAEPRIETRPEQKTELKPEPPKVEAKAETVSEPPAPSIAPKTSVAETAAATPAPAAAPTEPIVAAKNDEPAKVETLAPATPVPAASQQIAALADPDTTATISAPTTIDPSLVNARPIRRPPVPRDRPVDADVVAALPDPAIVMPAPEAAKPVVRRRKAVVRRVVRQRRSITRPAPTQNSASPFGR